MTFDHDYRRSAPAVLAGVATVGQRLVRLARLVDRMIEVRRQRRALLALSPRMRVDLALSDADILCEASRPPWDLPEQGARLGSVVERGLNSACVRATTRAMEKGRRAPA